VKGINILTAFYTAGNEYGKLQIPVDYQILSKTRIETEEKTGKERRVSEKSKNEMMREMTGREGGHFTRIDQLGLSDGKPLLVYLKFPVILYKHVFENKEGAVGERYLVTNDKKPRRYKMTYFNAF
jgi:hypothetical protein